MRALQPTTVSVSRAADRGPMCIALGLMTLIVACLWPAVPTLVAMSLVALGATGVTIRRCRPWAQSAPAIALHLFVYGGLYVLFVGAVFDGAASRQQNGLRLLGAVDVAISAVVMLLVARQCVAAMASRDAPAR